VSGLTALAALMGLAAAAALAACTINPPGWQPGHTADDCYAENRCGLWPPFYSNADDCGEPRLVCHGGRQ
jgi:hypothetical protein